MEQLKMERLKMELDALERRLMQQQGGMAVELDALERRLMLQQQCGMVAAAGRTRHLISRMCKRINAAC